MLREFCDVKYLRDYYILTTTLLNNETFMTNFNRFKEIITTNVPRTPEDLELPDRLSTYVVDAAHGRFHNAWYSDTHDADLKDATHLVFDVLAKLPHGSLLPPLKKWWCQ